MELTIRYRGHDKITKSLKNLSKHCKDLRPVWPAVRDIFIDHEKKQFATQGAHGRGRWAALSPKYAERKRRIAPGKPILVFSGEMRESFIGGSGFIYRPRRRDLIIGSSSKIAGYHHTGTRKMPRRDPKVPTRQMSKDWQPVIWDYLWEGVGEKRFHRGRRIYGRR